MQSKTVDQLAVKNRRQLGQPDRRELGSAEAGAVVQKVRLGHPEVTKRGTSRGFAEQLTHPGHLAGRHAGPGPAAVEQVRRRPVVSSLY